MAVSPSFVALLVVAVVSCVLPNVTAATQSPILLSELQLYSEPIHRVSSVAIVQRVSRLGSYCVPHWCEEEVWPARQSHASSFACITH